jgi:hypothetical protein
VSARALLAASVAGLAAAVVLVAGGARGDVAVSVVEDWSRQTVGATGVPDGWHPYETPGGHPRYDFQVVSDEGSRGLRLRSQDDHSTIAKEVHVDLRATPVLEWRWKIVKLPEGADLRSKATSDVTGHVLVAWPRFPALLRTRLIGYVWEATAPAPAMEHSRKTSLVTFFVLRSGPAQLGQWMVERRNVREDFRRAFGEDPVDPGAVAISIDTNDTRAAAEAIIGRIAFVSGP